MIKDPVVCQKILEQWKDRHKQELERKVFFVYDLDTNRSDIHNYARIVSGNFFYANNTEI